MKKLTLLLILFFSTLILFSQTYRNDINKSSIIINGTSNLHNWTSKSNDFNIEFIMNDNKVEKLNVIIPIKSIKSNEKLMDKKTYESLNSDKYSNIIFKLLEITELNINDNDINTIFVGNLSINNTIKKISLKFIGKKLNNNLYKFNGSTKIKMTDYNITPPTALLGTLKVSNNIELVFDIYLVK